jgi:hypothetical protein
VKHWPASWPARCPWAPHQCHQPPRHRPQQMLWEAEGLCVLWCNFEQN